MNDLAIANQPDIFLPMIMMVALVASVWFYMFVIRITHLTKNNIDFEAIPNADRLKDALPDSINNPAYNLTNMFEIPMLFFILCGMGHTLQIVDSGFLNAAWAFVAFRAIHSIIHCSYNKISHRFFIYQCSCFAVWYLMIKVFIALL